MNQNIMRVNGRKIASGFRLVSLLVALVTSGVVTFAASPTVVSAEQYTPEAVVRIMQPELNTYWGRVVRSMGYAYRAPSVFWYNTPQRPGEGISVSCGRLPADNSFYCPPTNSIFLDHSLMRWALREYGDYAVGFALAHEHAHAVQTFIGVTHRNDMGHISDREYEKQADCYAGVFTKYLESRGMLEPGDKDEGGAMAGWAAGRGSSTHGTVFERRFKYYWGYNGGTLARCNP